MRKWLYALILLLVLPLAGCKAMLERDSSSVEPHTQSLTAKEDPSALQAGNYQELVSAVLYLVTQHTEQGVVRLYNYTGDVEADLTAACLEVVQKDPLGAFAVDYIKHELTRIVSYYEASITVTYRRSAEDMGRITAVTGSSAIKSELGSALSSFSPETIQRISYFAEDDEYLLSLVRQAYYDTPLAAFGMPEVTVSLYPETGIQRIVEIDLTYPAEAENLLEKQAALTEAVNHLLLDDTQTEAMDLYDLLRSQVFYSTNSDLNTAYTAFVAGIANDEGMALAYKLLCDMVGLTCTVVQGQGEEGPRFWNIVTTSSGSRHVDCGEGYFGFTDLQLTEVGGYTWDSSYPICRDGSELQINS